MFDDLFEEFMDDDLRKSIQETEEVFKLIREKSEEGTSLLKEKMQKMGKDIVEDTVMLCPTTAPFEWDLDINEQLELKGSPTLLQVCIPKSVMGAFSIRNKIRAKVGEEQKNEQKNAQYMLKLIFMRGLTCFIHDEDHLRDRLISSQLMAVIKKMEKGDDE